MDAGPSSHNGIMVLTPAFCLPPLFVLPDKQFFGDLAGLFFRSLK